MPYTLIQMDFPVLHDSFNGLGWIMTISKRMAVFSSSEYFDDIYAPQFSGYPQKEITRGQIREKSMLVDAPPDYLPHNFH